VRDWPVEVFANTAAGHRGFVGKEFSRRKPTLARMIATGVQVAGQDNAAALIQDECRATLAGGPGPAPHDLLEDLRYGVTDLLDDLTHSRNRGEATTIGHVLQERLDQLALAVAGPWDGDGTWLYRELRAWDAEWATRWVAATHDDTLLATIAEESLHVSGGPLFEG
jgi:hypothetical protein